MVLIAPSGPQGLTPQWLSGALSSERAPVCVTSARVEKLGVQGFAGELFRVELDLAEGSAPMPPTLIAKFACPAPEQRTRQWELGMYTTEAGFYRQLAPSCGIAAPRCYYAYSSRRRDRFLLLLEEVLGTSRNDERGLTFDEAGAIVDVAARLHARWWGCARLERLRWLRSWRSHPNFRARSGNRQAWREIAAELPLAAPSDLKTVAWARRVLRAAPQTLIHGDLSGKNVIWHHSHPDGVHLLDWQLTRHGPAMLDIANLLAVGLAPEGHRRFARKLLERYHARLTGLLDDGVPFAALLREYQAALTLRCLRPLALSSYVDPIDPVGVLAARELERTTTAVEFAFSQQP